MSVSRKSSGSCCVLRESERSWVEESRQEAICAGAARFGRASRLPSCRVGQFLSFAPSLHTRGARIWTDITSLGAAAILLGHHDRRASHASSCSSRAGHQLTWRPERHSRNRSEKVQQYSGTLSQCKHPKRQAEATVHPSRCMNQESSSSAVFSCCDDARPRDPEPSDTARAEAL